MLNLTKPNNLIQKLIAKIPANLKTNINFWNIVFALTLSLSTTFTTLSFMNKVSLIPLMIEQMFLFVFLPFMVKYLKIIRLNEKKEFLDINNKKINLNRLPGPFLVIISTFLAMYLLISFLTKFNSPFETLNWLLMNLTFFFIPTSFFIAQNIPIFVVFYPTHHNKLNSYKGSYFSSSEYIARQNAIESSRRRTSIMYSYLPGNTNYRR